MARWALYMIGLGIWLSGGLWLLFHYFFVTSQQFGPQPHPLEPWLLKLHGAFAFGAIWIFGLLCGVHVSRTWQSKLRRGSGVALTVGFAWLILSGYLLYYTGDESNRAVISIIHWTTGLISPVCLACHRIRFRKRAVLRTNLTLTSQRDCPS
ncbi:MAG TPA: hypothetical protein VKY31_10800 [Terriglobia bacterium]|nr:hypothetical protein [Terriglobia bacterium]